MMVSPMAGPHPLPLARTYRGTRAHTLSPPLSFPLSKVPITQGGGLELVAHLMRGETLSQDAGLFLALKLAATALTLASGGIGGVWLPSVGMWASISAAFDGWLGLGQPGYMTLVGGAGLPRVPPGCWSRLSTSGSVFVSIHGIEWWVMFPS